ncbi:hypothetical protein RND71_024985 [Anisodus tanguticus]|uniref:Uncharacterized protein n=1 Tax=Anisodus tanguticus TaxID=243964 RepID=A0AAE1RRM5_9SOLA|nr:hypothetical protein RND71_024985 [Anisodus tanguticus]
MAKLYKESVNASSKQNSNYSIGQIGLIQVELHQEHAHKAELGITTLEAYKNQVQSSLGSYHSRFTTVEPGEDGRVVGWTTKGPRVGPQKDQGLDHKRTKASKACDSWSLPEPSSRTTLIVSSIIGDAMGKEHIRDKFKFSKELNRYLILQD